MDYGYSDLNIWQNINAVNLSLKEKGWQYCSKWKNLNFKTKIRIAENLYLSLWHASQHSKSFLKRSLSSVQFSSVAHSCPTLCGPLDWRTPGFPVHHQLPEFTQTHVHQVSDAIQPSHPLSSPSPPAFNLSSIRVFSNESVLHRRWPKYWSFSFSIRLSNEYSGLI